MCSTSVFIYKAFRSNLNKIYNALIGPTVRHHLLEMLVSQVFLGPTTYEVILKLADARLRRYTEDGTISAM